MTKNVFRCRSIVSTYQDCLEKRFQQSGWLPIDSPIDETDTLTLTLGLGENSVLFFPHSIF